MPSPFEIRKSKVQNPPQKQYMDQNLRQLNNSRLTAGMVTDINGDQSENLGISDKSEYFSVDFSEIHGFQGFPEI